MNHWQKAIKYAATAFAIFLAVSIISGILGIIAIFGFAFDKTDTPASMTEYDISDNITALDIDVGAADFSVVFSDKFKAESNLSDITIEEKNGTLYIKQDESFFKTDTDNVKFTLFIPEGTQFENVSIVTGAGALKIGTLYTDILQLELGAGRADIGALWVTDRANINGGAGKLTVNGGQIYNLNLNMGVGETLITSRLLGSTEMDLGVGSTDILLIGGQNDYTVEINSGIGNVKVGSTVVKENQMIGNGERKINLDCGVGNVDIYFSE